MLDIVLSVLLGLAAALMTYGIYQSVEYTFSKLKKNKQHLVEKETGSKEPDYHDFLIDLNERYYSYFEDTRHNSYVLSYKMLEKSVAIVNRKRDGDAIGNS